MNNATQVKNKCIRTAILTEMAVKQHHFYVCIRLDKKCLFEKMCQLIKQIRRTQIKVSRSN